MFWLSRLSEHSTYAGGLLGPMMLAGLGMGLTFVPLSLVALAKVPNKDSGVAASLLNTGQQVGGSDRPGDPRHGGLVGRGVEHEVGRGRHGRPHLSQAAQTALGNHALAYGFGRGYLVSAGIAFLALVIALIDDPDQEGGPGGHRPDGGAHGLTASHGGRADGPPHRIARDRVRRRHVRGLSARDGGGLAGARRMDAYDEAELRGRARPALPERGRAACPAGGDGRPAPAPSTASRLLALFDAQAGSRHLDLAARYLRAEGRGFYTIGSAGHEANAAVAAALRPTDPALLHYRSGAFYLARAAQVPGSLRRSRCSTCCSA